MDRFGQQMSQQANSSVRESCVCAIYSYFVLNFLAPKIRVSVVYPYERIQSHISHTNQGKDTNRAVAGWKTGAVFVMFKGRHHVMSDPSISGTSVNLF